jgi:hypothetical protein
LFVLVKSFARIPSLPYVVVVPAAFPVPTPIVITKQTATNNEEIIFFISHSTFEFDQLLSKGYPQSNTFIRVTRRALSRKLTSRTKQLWFSFPIVKKTGTFNREPVFHLNPSKSFTDTEQHGC